jgi:sugar lactone lactonase YvrE
MTRMMKRVHKMIAAVSLCAITTFAQSQVPTIENFAGGGKYLDFPGTELAIWPYGMALAPDGAIYVSEFSLSRVRRFDPANGTVSSVPEAANVADIRIIARSVAMDSLGRLYVAVNSYGSTPTEIWRYDVVTGERVAIAGMTGLNAYVGMQVGNIALDAAGNLYVPEEIEHVVRVVRPNGVVEIFAGGNSAGFSGDFGPATAASLDGPSAVVADSSGNVYIADTGNHRVRIVNPSGMIYTVAGLGGTLFLGDGGATTTNLSEPRSLALLPDGSLAIGDAGHARIRRLHQGFLSTLAGNGNHGFTGDGELATSATIGGADSLVSTPNGDIYFSVVSNGRVRRIDATTRIISTVFGNGTDRFCGDGHPAIQACFSGLTAIATDGADNVYVGDTSNGRVRKIDSATALVSTLAGLGTDVSYRGEGGPGANFSFGGQTNGVALDATGNVYAASNFPSRVVRIDALTGIVTTLAGTGVSGFSGDGGLATVAQLNRPTHIAIDSAGNVYISDGSNHRVRKVAAGTGIISTFAGSGNTSGSLGDGGPATSASLFVPGALAFDSTGNLLISDQLHCRVRKVEMTTQIITTFAGNGVCNPSGNGTQATSAATGRVLSIARSPAGEIFLGSYFEIRKVDSAGIISEVVGASTPLDNPSGSPVQYVYGIAFDSAGRLLITAFDPERIRRIGNLPVPPPADSTPPVVEPVISGLSGNAGWYRGDVAVSWNVHDAESSISSSDGCGSSQVTADTAGVTFTCTATSTGGTATQSITIRRDATAPTIVPGSASPAPSAAGWNLSDVALPFTTGDAMSGVANASASSPLQFTGEGAGVERSVVVTDIAGNTATLSHSTNIDRTPPQIVWTTPAAGVTYGAYTSLVATYSCSDSLSGVSTCSGTHPAGTALATNVAGAFNFQVSVTDNAGNVNIASRGFNVAAMAFERFIEPLRRSPTLNGVTAGSLVPIRWRLLSAGQVVTNPAAFQSFTVLNLACQGTAVPLIDTATGGPGLTVNPANGYFIYNWQTDASWAGTCRRVQIRLGDNSVREVVFRLN